jgi:hypothetical protein
MTAPIVDPTSIRLDQKQGRAFEARGVVRVFSAGDYLVGRLQLDRDSAQIQRLLGAPNALAVRNRAGKLVGIRLHANGDDRGQRGESHGRSSVSTERVINDFGNYVGSDRNLKHKLENALHANPEPHWAKETSVHPLRPPIASLQPK